MQLVILGLLLDGPLSLYDVRKRFAAGISLFYSTSFGSIQRALTQLVEARQITLSEPDASARGKRLYTVTDAGRAHWRAEMLAPLTSGADAETQALARIYLLGRLESAADRLAALDRVQAQTEASLAQLRGLAEQVDAVDVAAEHRDVFGFQRATLDYGLRSHVLMLEWLQELRASV